MNREVIEQWVTALESGEYPQTVGKLHRKTENSDDGAPAGFCCLGVLCEIAVEQGVIEPGVVGIDGAIGYQNADGSNIGENGAPYTALPPKSVVEWAGLDQEMTVTATYDAYDYDLDETVTHTKKVEFTALNDVYGFTFPQIAKAIREDYLT